jgi:hypothetical protein
MLPVIPYGRTGAIIALTEGAILRAIAIGAVLSAPLFATPCGSSVPVGSSTVWTFAGTVSRNSIQLIRSISRLGTESRTAMLLVWVSAGKQEIKTSVNTAHRLFICFYLLFEIEVALNSAINRAM